MQSAVVAAQPHQAIVDVSKQAIGLKGRQLEHAAKGDVAADLKTSRSAIQKAESRQDAFVRPGAGCAHFGRGVFNCACRPVARGKHLRNGALFRRSAFPARPDRGTLHRPLEFLFERVTFSCPAASATSVWLTPAPSNCCTSAMTSASSLKHRVSRSEERVHTARTIHVDATNDAVLRDAEGLYDIHLAAYALADQLGGKHPKGAARFVRRVETPAEHRRSMSIGHFRGQR